MKNVISMLLFCALIAPVSAQKVRTDHGHKQTATKKADCDAKDCKCACHKKGQKKATTRGRKRGATRGRSFRSNRGRGSRSRRGAATKKSNSSKKVQAQRKKWAEAMKKRVDSSNKKRDGEWRKRIEEMRKTFQLQLRDGRFIA